ncbi:MAG: hypothetical protein LQ351_005731 [Letrouitia transgressa]|nr:MAG: hypothetical protein LQ351_005731 [Letrouitia transgressa]
MHQKPVQGPEKPLKKFSQKSSSLPFGQAIPLPDIAGPTYVTAQTLIQQVAYILSDRVWTYSPDTFDLDVAVKQWMEEGGWNSRGYQTNVQQMQIRQGAASIALGYVFSKDFDFNKRHIPQSILATSSSLSYLRTALGQLSLQYSTATPFVAHIAAIDYVGGSPSLVTDYVSAMTFAEELGYIMVLSCSAYESQHMSLFATLLSNIAPAFHIYDGVDVGRETTRVIDVLDKSGLDNTYKVVLEGFLSLSNKKQGLDTRVQQLLQAFNEELGTTYQPFEYHGHATPESLLVVFGSVESSLASQVVCSLEKDDVQVGLLVVRIYRPFVEDDFLRLVPSSVKTIGILGQVQDDQDVADPMVHSRLFGDVATAVTFSGRWVSPPAVADFKYPRERIWTPISIAAVFQLLVKKPLAQSSGQATESHKNLQLQLNDSALVQQYTFWDLSDSLSVTAATAIGQALSKEATSNVTVNTRHDNLLQGGVARTDIRRSKKTVEAPYSVEAADLVYIGDLSLISYFDIGHSVKSGGKVILRLPGIKDEELEKKLPDQFRDRLSSNDVELFVLDPFAIAQVAEDETLETYIVQLVIHRIGLPSSERQFLTKLASINGSFDLFQDLAGKLEEAWRKVEVPKEWATNDLEKSTPRLPLDLRPNSFVGFEKTESEAPAYLKDWQTAGKALVFKEAYETKLNLRPDLSIKTHTVRVMENRRLTPPTYDRNIFHIEFDLGDSGLKYEIGEALGIHAENDNLQVEEFIKFYKIDPNEIVEVPNRENPRVLENRTVWQALKQNIDIFGRPPKRFYEALAEFADDPSEKHELQALGGPEGAVEFKRRAEVDTVTYADVLLEFPSAHPAFHDIVRIVSPMKRREYSIASCQKVTPNSVALMIVVVNWVDPKGRDRFGQATKYLNDLKVGTPVTVSVKPSVMKLPPSSTHPLIMAGLGTGLAPFRAFVQHRAWEKAQGKEIGSVLLYMGSRHQREEYCYGEEWEAYQDAGVITLLGRAFSRDQPQKIYIQDRMRETLDYIIQAYLKEEGAFYLCGPTWPVPDVTNVLEDAISQDSKLLGKRTDPKKEIERLKDQLRYVLEVY